MSKAQRVQPRRQQHALAVTVREAEAPELLFIERSQCVRRRVAGSSNHVHGVLVIRERERLEEIADCHLCACLQPPYLVVLDGLRWWLAPLNQLRVSVIFFIATTALLYHYHPTDQTYYKLQNQKEKQSQIYPENFSVAVHPNETWTWGAAPRWAAGGGVEVLAMGLRNQCGINNYRYNADILRATSSSLFHPFAVHDKFEPGAPPSFDATEVEDPNVVELPDGSGTLLFYTGAWVKGDVALNCSDGDKLQPDSGPLANAQRIGVAYRKQGETTWQRSASPILSTREGKWDSTRVSNPAGIVFPNGTTVLAYRGNGNTGHGGIGVATAAHWSGPYTHLYESPLFSGYAEDPTLFFDKNGMVHMVAHGELPPQP